MSAGYCDIRLRRRDFSLHAAFEIPDRGVLGLFGHSGSGKTTLLRCVAGLESDAEGEIRVGRETWLSSSLCLPAHRRNIGYVFQDSRLFPHRTVEQNLDYGVRRQQRRGLASDIDRDHMLELFAIGNLLQRRPHELSGGEKQRVAIARALLKQPDVLLMDEPLASLDDRRKREILPYLEKLHDELSIPMLYVSHSLQEVSRLCDRLLVIENGRVLFTGSIHDALVSPESPLSHERNAAAMLECTVTGFDSEYRLATVETQGGNCFYVHSAARPGSKIRLRIKANDVSLSVMRPDRSSILNIIETRVSEIRREDESNMLLTLTAKDEVLLSRISRKSLHRLEVEEGAHVYAQIKAVSIHNN